MQTIYYIVLIPMVYVAFAVFIAGTALRLVKLFREPKHPAVLQIFPYRRPAWLMALHDTFLLPSVRRHSPLLWVFLMLFHTCFLVLILGHIELINEFRIFQLIPHEPFIGKGLIGLTLCIALLYFLFRRFKSPVRDISVPEDYYILVLLLLAAIFGSAMDWARTWYDYSSFTVPDYRSYLWSLLSLKPEVPGSIAFSGHSFMLVLHVFFANIFLMLFPFSKIMHSFLALPLNKLRRG